MLASTSSNFSHINGSGLAYAACPGNCLQLLRFYIKRSNLRITTIDRHSILHEQVGHTIQLHTAVPGSAVPRWQRPIIMKYASSCFFLFSDKLASCCFPRHNANMRRLTSLPTTSQLLKQAVCATHSSHCPTKLGTAIVASSGGKRFTQHLSSLKNLIRSIPSILTTLRKVCEYTAAPTSPSCWTESVKNPPVLPVCKQQPQRANLTSALDLPWLQSKYFAH